MSLRQILYYFVIPGKDMINHNQLMFNGIVLEQVKHAKFLGVYTNISEGINIFMKPPSENTATV